MFIGRRREIALLDGFINALLTRRKDAIDGCMIGRVRDKKEERIVPRERDYPCCCNDELSNHARFTYLRVNWTIMGIKR